MEVASIANGQLFHQSCLCNEAYLTAQKDWVERASRLENMLGFRKLELHGLFLCISSIKAIAVLCSFIINQ